MADVIVEPVVKLIVHFGVYPFLGDTRIFSISYSFLGIWSMCGRKAKLIEVIEVVRVVGIVAIDHSAMVDLILELIMCR